LFVNWILIFIFLMVSADILGWTAFAVLLSKLLAWVPNLIISIAIFIVAVVVADILERLPELQPRKWA